MHPMTNILIWGRRLLGGRTTAPAMLRNRASSFPPAIEALEDRQAPNNLADFFLGQQEALLGTLTAFRGGPLEIHGSELPASALVNAVTVNLSADVTPQHLADAL